MPDTASPAVAYARLDDRAVVRLDGPDVRHFLHNVVTCNVEALGAGESRFGALLTPQGKIISDFLLHAPMGGPHTLFMDLPRELAAEMVKRLSLYRLRAKVEIALREDLAVAARWGETELPDQAEVFADPRLPDLGARLILPAAGAPLGDPAGYEAHRIALGVPKGGADFIFGETFPHDADMDQLGGLDFAKGCYVGQEVVSRMQHRGIARKRAVIASFKVPPSAGAQILAGDKLVGRMGVPGPHRAIALVRLDRAADARGAGLPLVADGVDIAIEKPVWAAFDLDGAHPSAL